MLYQEPRTLHALLDKLASAVTAYLLAQIEAGAQAVMLFDSWGGSLAWQAYREYSLAYMQRIITGIGDKAPVILFTKGGGNWLDMMKDSGAAAVGLDWTTPLASARSILGENIALQGNLDPAILRASPDIIENEVRRVLADLRPRPPPHLQPRPRHHPGHPARTRGSDDRSRTQTQPAIPQGTPMTYNLMNQHGATLHDKALNGFYYFHAQPRCAL